jgi:hypothetical protein
MQAPWLAETIQCLGDKRDIYSGSHSHASENRYKLFHALRLGNYLRPKADGVSASSQRRGPAVCKRLIEPM